MRVFVQCPKGHRFACEDRHLGKRVLCAHNGCGEKFRLVPVELGRAGADVPLPAVFDHGGRCAFCGAAIRLGAPTCRGCGADLMTGEQRRYTFRS